MTYPEFLAKMAERADITKKLAREVMAAAFDVLGSAAATERIEVPGFGAFLPRSRKARFITNPVTKERMRLPRSRTVGFRASKELRAKAARK